MPPTKTWKSRERKVAAFFGTKRTPLSGGNSGHTRSDSLHEKLFVEAKHRKVHSAVTLWRDAKAKASKEQKTPIVALSEHNKPGFWVLVHSSDIEEVLRIITEETEGE